MTRIGEWLSRDLFDVLPGDIPAVEDEDEDEETTMFS